MFLKITLFRVTIYLLKYIFSLLFCAHLKRNLTFFWFGIQFPHKELALLFHGTEIFVFLFHFQSNFLQEAGSLKVLKKLTKLRYEGTIVVLRYKNINSVSDVAPFVLFYCAQING